MSKKTETITLNAKEIDFIKHFIIQCNENLCKGRVDDAHHDAMAVLLCMQGILGMDDDWPKERK